MTRKAVPYLLPGLICSDYVWSAQLRELKRFRAVAVPGYGAADSISAMAETILNQAPERLSVAGHSMGARVALEMFRQAPRRIARIALLDTGVHPVSSGERAKRMALLQVGQRLGMAALVDEWLPPMVHPDRRNDEHFMAPLRKMALSAGIQQFERQTLALLSRPEVSGLLAAIECPTLVGVGRQDEWSPLAQHETITAQIRGAKLAIFENAGHMSPIEAPGSVSRALVEWLET